MSSYLSLKTVKFVAHFAINTSVNAAKQSLIKAAGLLPNLSLISQQPNISAQQGCIYPQLNKLLKPTKQS
jgi:hypothetical protein